MTAAFSTPDIVQTRDANAAYDGILIASGDRANPLETTVQNYLYLIKDRRTTSGNPSGTVLTSNDLLDTTACVDSDAQCAKSNDYTNGWKIQLNAEGDHAGEKGLASPLTADGHVYFTTYRPDAKLAGSCGPVEGMGALYIVNLKDGTAVFDNRSQEIGPGIPPQVTALDDTTIIIPGSGIPDSDDPDSNERYKLLETDGKGMYIIYWREPGVDKL